MHHQNQHTLTLYSPIQMSVKIHIRWLWVTILINVDVRFNKRIKSKCLSASFTTSCSWVPSPDLRTEFQCAVGRSHHAGENAFPTQLVIHDAISCTNTNLRTAVLLKLYLNLVIIRIAPPNLIIKLKQIFPKKKTTNKTKTNRQHQNQSLSK